MLNHVIVYDPRPKVCRTDGVLVGYVDDILASKDCEAICKTLVHPHVKVTRLPGNFDRDWEGDMRQEGYRHYVNDDMQKFFAKNFYLFDETATDSFKSFLKTLKNFF